MLVGVILRTKREVVPKLRSQHISYQGFIWGGGGCFPRPPPPPPGSWLPPPPESSYQPHRQYIESAQIGSFNPLIIFSFALRVGGSIPHILYLTKGGEPVDITENRVSEATRNSLRC